MKHKAQSIHNQPHLSINKKTPITQLKTENEYVKE